MNTKTYSAPLCEVRKTRVRMSILAGSNNTSNQVVTGRDFGFGARQRVNTSSINEDKTLFEY